MCDLNAGMKLQPEDVFSHHTGNYQRIATIASRLALPGPDAQCSAPESRRLLQAAAVPSVPLTLIIVPHTHIAHTAVAPRGKGTGVRREGIT